MQSKSNIEPESAAADRRRYRQSYEEERASDTINHTLGNHTTPNVCDTRIRMSKHIYTQSYPIIIIIKSSNCDDI